MYSILYYCINKKLKIIGTVFLFFFEFENDLIEDRFTDHNVKK